MGRIERERSPKVDGYVELVERFGDGAVADALLAKWLSDPAGDEGFRRLQAMIDVPRARLSHLTGTDAEWYRVIDDDYIESTPAIERLRELRRERLRLERRARGIMARDG